MTKHLYSDIKAMQLNGTKNALEFLTEVKMPQIPIVIYNLIREPIVRTIS